MLSSDKPIKLVNTKLMKLIETLFSNFQCKKVTLLIFALLSLNPVMAKVKLPRLISHGMVLQRDRPIKIWGWASPDESVTVIFNQKTFEVKTNHTSKWEIVLPAMPAGGPYVMSIHGSNVITVKDILMGDVWLCSGQSNMEYTMNRSKELYEGEIANSKNPEIRQFLVKNNIDFSTHYDVVLDGWRSADPASVLRFTAVGYFFAKELYEKYHVPIGLILSSVGGTAAESWISEEGLKEFPQYLEQIKPYQDSSFVANLAKTNQKLTRDWYQNLKVTDEGFLSTPWYLDKLDTSDWKTLTVPGSWSIQELKNLAGVVWLRKEVYLKENLIGKDAVLYLGNITDRDSTYINGKKIGYNDSKYMLRRYSISSNLLKPGKNVIMVRVLFSSNKGEFTQGKPYSLVMGDQTIPLTGDWKYKVSTISRPFPDDKIIQVGRLPVILNKSLIAPLESYPIKGVIWYQGEANVSKAYEYRKLFTTLIKDWRSKRQEGDFPFLFVQLSNLGAKPKEPGESTWAELREAQSMALALLNTGMAVTHDIGQWNDIHPLNKMDVGKRLALAAQKVAYGDKNVVSSGPTFKSMKIIKNQCIITFDNIGSGLKIKSDGNLNQFTIAGADHKFLKANIRIENNKIFIWNDALNQPVAVRYAWANNPEGDNLYNYEGLPASSFRTDDWKGITN